MSCHFRWVWALALLGTAFPAIAAEEGSTDEELRKLRTAVEQQTKQIEALAQQIARLSPPPESAKNSTLQPSAASAETPVPSSEPPKAEAIQKAEAAPGARHIVVKGETLTSIAKHSNIPLLELQKANKIEDGRKLQIGQTLIIPPPLPPETSTEKKENP